MDTKVQAGLKPAPTDETMNEIAKELARQFNSAKIPELGYLEMSRYLSRIGIKYFGIMMCRELRDKFFDIKKQTISSRKTTIYSPKKEPVYFTRFIDLLVYYKNYTKLHGRGKTEAYNMAVINALKTVFSEKSVIPYAQLRSAFYAITKEEIGADRLNGLLSKNTLAYNDGFYYLPQKIGEQLIGSDYTEPEFLTPKEKKAKKKH
jgi:hypothetical protein